MEFPMLIDPVSKTSPCILTLNTFDTNNLQSKWFQSAHRCSVKLGSYQKYYSDASLHNTWIQIFKGKYPIYSGWIQLLCLCWMNNSFTSLVKSKPVKQEVRPTVILPPTVSVLCLNPLLLWLWYDSRVHYLNKPGIENKILFIFVDTRLSHSN